MGEPLTLESLAKRVAELEAKAAAPRELDEPAWWSAVGMFDGDDIYREIARLGAEIRQAERDELEREWAHRDSEARAAEGGTP